MFVERTIICWGLFSFTWNLFIYLNMMFLQSQISRVKCINCDDPKQYKMLFVKCSNGHKLSFYNNARLKMKQKISLIVFLKFFS